MQIADPRLLEEVGDLVYARLIQVLNFYGAMSTTGYAYAQQELRPSGDDRAVTIHYKSKEM
ncbi:hypothetical protein HUN01_25040 [Nostoc edaphicum CCNP1411]|uniref:Uncharacterized protein n=1 Tax=Nostoc edaphicum CCNP1411 TaxID=1472755 RepID=A0A7D7LG21_9NOSO|nr:hypothetical protein [Nostoc edaphicum]QMS90690.1 hypothetical protein HUN01_25040 [Nostoc edaphicum CCNP1411]